MSADLRDQQALLGWLADRLIASVGSHPLRVGIDGPCGAGKSTLARALVAEIRLRGHPAVHLDSDGFHNARAIRMRDEQDSARGYYADAYDFSALIERVLLPLGPGGDRVYATKIHDLATDEIFDDLIETAQPDAIVVFDCTFLQRGELRSHWDEVIYLDAARNAALERGAARDAASRGGLEAARQSYEDRYMAACDIYRREERPAELASILIGYDSPAEPVLLRG